MNIRTAIATLGALAVLAPAALAQTTGRAVDVRLRAAYSIGATAPIGLPATIRSIESFRLTPNFVVGASVSCPLSPLWGLRTALLAENKGMDGEVVTKGYSMRLAMDDDEMEGRYTGHVRQKVRQVMLTVPVQLTAEVSPRVQLRAGPYVSLLLSRDFSGEAFSGYLRKDDPTGPRVVMGSADDERATYDFSADMRRWQLGVTAGADWLLGRRWGLSADLSWGLTGIFRSGFHTVEQTLYPIYGTIGVFYQL